MTMWVYICLAAMALGSLGGYGLRDMMAEAEQAQAVSFALAKAEAEYEITRSEEIALIKSQQKTKVIYKTITKEVPKYVSVIQKTDSDCNLSLGAVSVFNSAALERMSEAAGINDTRNTQPSTVKESDLIDYSLEVIDQYNQVKNQCNALIRWHNNVSTFAEKKD